MRLAASTLVIAGLVLGCTSAARAEAPSKKQTPQERKRQQLLDELGLRRAEMPSAAPTPAVVPASDAPRETVAPPVTPRGRPAPGPAAPATPPAPSFRRAVHPLLTQTCQPCHRTGGPAAMTRLVLGGNPSTDFAPVRGFVNPAAPLTSVLLAKAAGQTHGGGAPWPVGGEAHTRVLAWIAKGARLDGPAMPAPVPVPTTAAIARPLAPRPTAAIPTPAIVAPPEVEEAAVAAPAPSAPNAKRAAAQPAPGATTRPLPSITPLLGAACLACHNARGAAAATRFVLSGEPAADETAALAMLDPAAPARSPLVTKATGELHGGGIVLPPDDPRLAALLAWVDAATKTVTKPSAPKAPTPGTPPPLPPVAMVVPVAPVPALAPHGPHGPHGPVAGLVLPGGFMLNGRFDLVYERQRFSTNPFADGSAAALRSYHHFLFLSRESTTNPFGLSVELLSLQFWEAHARLGGGVRPWRLVIAGGKIIVPFGADPLTHQSYGGLIGYDQRILPVLWTQEGAAAHLTVGRGRLLLTDDLFAIRGYALPRADAVLNLQGDFSPADDARIGWGNRLGLSWLFASAWYSTLVNPLGFGRRLFMQAIDVTLWRPRPIPVLGHFSAATGLLRADVSGGGPGLDYYHFGSYFQLRYHPTDWLYLQYRQGLRTFDNRRGVIVDQTRLSPEDASTHNFAVVARFGGLSVAMAYFLIFEKAGELPNDLLRASVTYEF